MKIFNPDFEIFGNFDETELENAERREFGRREVDADKDCPFDRTLCRQKLVRVIAWKHAIERLGAGRIAHMIYTSANMFHDCPVPQLNCIRRERYKRVLKTWQEHQKQ